VPRVFVAVYPDPAVRAALEEALARLRSAPEAGRVRWVRPEQWHVTLQFLGEVAELAPLSAALDRLAGSGPVVARLGPASGWLPGGRVLQVPVVGLDPVAARVRDQLRAGARVPEGGDLPFRGHLTLGRARGRPVPDRSPQGASGSVWWEVPCTAEFAVEELVLVVSTLGAGPPRHEVVHRVALRA
jgi:2'-5' RNA ligase